MTDRRRGGEDRLIERHVRELGPDTRQVGPHGLPLAVHYVALGTGARAGKHPPPPESITAPLHEVGHRRQFRTAAGLRERQDARRFNTHVGPRACGHSRGCYLEQRRRKLAGLCQSDHSASPVGRADHRPDRVGPARRRRCRIPHPFFEERQRLPVATDTEHCQQPGRRLVAAGEYRPNGSLPLHLEREAHCLSRLAVVDTRQRRHDHEAGQELGQSEAAGDFVEGGSARNEMSGLDHAGPQGRLGQVARLESQHQLRQNHSRLLRVVRERDDQRPHMLAHGPLGLEVERSQAGERLVRRGRGVADDFAEQLRRTIRPAPPDDLAARRALPAVAHLHTPGCKPAVPLALASQPSRPVGPDPEGLEFPAIAGCVLSGKLRPGPVGPLADNAPNRDRPLAADGGHWISREFLNQPEHIPLDTATEPDRDHPQVFVGVAGEPGDPA